MQILFCAPRNIPGDGLPVLPKPKTAGRYWGVLRGAFILTVLITFAAASVFAKQGAMRALYTVPNSTFIEVLN